MRKSSWKCKKGKRNNKSENFEKTVNCALTNMIGCATSFIPSYPSNIEVVNNIDYLAYSRVVFTAAFKFD